MKGQNCGYDKRNMNVVIYTTDIALQINKWLRQTNNIADSFHAELANCNVMYTTSGTLHVCPPVIDLFVNH